LRRQFQGSVTLFGPQSKQRGKQWPVALGADQHLFQAVELIVIVVIGPDPGSERKLLDDRIERRIRMIR
jgi:hypothetical protein